MIFAQAIQVKLDSLVNIALNFVTSFACRYTTRQIWQIGP